MAGNSRSCRSKPFQFQVASSHGALGSSRLSQSDSKSNLTQFSVMPDTGLLFSREEKLKFASRMLNRLLSNNKKVYSPSSSDRGNEPRLSTEPKRRSSLVESIQNNIVIQDSLCTARAALTSSKIRSRADVKIYESPQPSPTQELSQIDELQPNIANMRTENHEQSAQSPGRVFEASSHVLRARTANKPDVIGRMP